jgi:NAD(P)-dependent dehydrogenase (short-subunit alcohol dehydrogenase family)
MGVFRQSQLVNVTTSLGTMIREGSPTYGPSKATLEAFSAIMAKDLAGTGVTANVLVPGGGNQYRHGTATLNRSGLRPSFPARPIWCSAFRLWSASVSGSLGAISAPTPDRFPRAALIVRENSSIELTAPYPNGYARGP